MNITTARIGQRVVTNSIIDIFPLGIWPRGTTGVISEIGEINGQQVAYVKLDEHFTDLDEWNNCIIAWADTDEANLNVRMTEFDPA